MSNDPRASNDPGDATITTDAAGLVIGWDAAAEQHYGWPSADVLGRPLYDLVVPRAQRSSTLNIMAAAAAGRSWSGQAIWRHRNGTSLRVALASNPIRGVTGAVNSIVHVSIPIATERSATRNGEPGHSPRILVAEDDSRSRELMAEVLRDAGYEVTEVADGARALDALRDRRRSFDLAVLDMQMPHVDGLAVAAEIRRDERLKQLPVLAVTALSGPEDAVRILEAGCDAYLAKPISVGDVRKMVAEILADATLL